MTININKAQTVMLNKTQQKPLNKQILSHNKQKWQSQIFIFSKILESFRLNIVRQTMSFPYHFEFHLGKHDLFTMYTNNIRNTISFFQL